MKNRFEWKAKWLPRRVKDERTLSASTIVYQQARITELEKILRNVQDDMWDTAIVNQMNLTGTKPNCTDNPRVFAIGSTKVHQRGIDESVRLVYKIREVLK